jgi:hypothetical protein
VKNADASAVVSTAPALSVTPGTNGQSTVAADLSSLADGVYTVEVRATDIAGNVSVQTQSLRVDKTAPLAPASIQVSSALNGISNSEKTDGVEVLVSLAGTGASLGDRLDILLAGASFTEPAYHIIDSADLEAGTATVLVSGKSAWGADGSKVLAAVITDVAGNVGAAISLTVSLDTTAPGAPVVQSVSSSTNGINAQEAAAGIDVIVTLSGTNAVAGDSVELLLGGATFSKPIRHTLTAQDIAAGQVTLAIAQTAGWGEDGTKSLTAKLTDIAGNISQSSQSLQVNLDTTPPSPAFVQTVADNDVINASERTAGVWVSGTKDADTTVTLNGHSVTADTTTWTYFLDQTTISGFGEGGEALQIVAEDLAGNRTLSSKVITVDTAAPTFIDGNNVLVTNSTGSNLLTNGTTVNVYFDPLGMTDIQSVMVDFSAYGATQVQPAIYDAGLAKFVAQYQVKGTNLLDASFLHPIVSVTDMAGNKSATVIGRTVSGNQLTLEFNDPVSTVPAVGSFSVMTSTQSGETQTVDVSRVEHLGNKWILTLSSSVTREMRVKVKFMPTNSVQDDYGQTIAVDNAYQPVVNNTAYTATAPVIDAVKFIEKDQAGNRHYIEIVGSGFSRALDFANGETKPATASAGQTVASVDLLSLGRVDISKLQWIPVGGQYEGESVLGDPIVFQNNATAFNVSKVLLSNQATAKGPSDVLDIYLTDSTGPTSGWGKLLSTGLTSTDTSGVDWLLLTGDSGADLIKLLSGFMLDSSGAPISLAGPANGTEISPENERYFLDLKDTVVGTPFQPGGAAGVFANSINVGTSSSSHFAESAEINFSQVQSSDASVTIQDVLASSGYLTLTNLLSLCGNGGITNLANAGSIDLSIRDGVSAQGLNVYNAGSASVKLIMSGYDFFPGSHINGTVAVYGSNLQIAFDEESDLINGVPSFPILSMNDLLSQHAKQTLVYEGSGLANSKFTVEQFSGSFGGAVEDSIDFSNSGLPIGNADGTLDSDANFGGIQWDSLTGLLKSSELEIKSSITDPIGSKHFHYVKDDAGNGLLYFDATATHHAYSDMALIVTLLGCPLITSDNIKIHSVL